MKELLIIRTYIDKHTNKKIDRGTKIKVNEERFKEFEKFEEENKMKIFKVFKEETKENPEKSKTKKEK